MRLLCVVPLVVFLQVITASPCPASWTLNGNVCYWYSGDLIKSWSGAEDYCNAHGGQLVTLKNTADVTYASSLITNTLFSTWSGLYKNGTSWKWIDGTSTLFAPWIKGQPAANDGSCGAIRTNAPRGLYTLPCNYNQPFICKQFAASCSSKNYTSTTGTITSPGYPANYANNLDCVQLIYAVGKRFVQLSFDVWMVENKTDYVNIYNGIGTSPTQLVAHIDSDPTSVNSLVKNSFQTNSNVMTVLFHTDNIITKKGWSATYKTIADAPDVHQNGSSGQITSHNYPKEYDSYTEQYFYISAPNGTQISLTFDYFDTETLADYLIVYDSATADPSLMLGKFSGHVNSTLPAMPGPFSSTGNSMTLYFRTDGIIQYKGWSASWNIF